MIYKIYEGVLVSIMTVMVVLLVSGKAHADNDGLAFDFVSAEENEVVKKCYVFAEINNHEYNQVKYWPTGEIESCESIKDIVKQMKNDISVEECFNQGVYTKEIAAKVSANKKLAEFNVKDFYNIGDYCQEVHEELYPEYKYKKINDRIRRIVK